MMNQIFEISKEIAQRNYEAVSEAQGRLHDEVAANFRWILATLATVNGGGAAALISTNGVTLAGKLAAGRWLCCGIAAAIILGFFQMRGAAAGIRYINDLKDFWISAGEVGHFDEDERQAKGKTVWRKVLPWIVSSYLSGFVSLGCFLRGAFEVGQYLK